jgi:pimeloyl-ACP methyl ester carboxylesterase
MSVMIDDGAAVVARLCDVVRSLRVLAPRMNRPLRLALLPGPRDATAPASPAAEALVAAAFERIGVQGLRFSHGEERHLTSFEYLLSQRISAAFDHGYQGFDETHAVEAARRLIDAQAFDTYPPLVQPATVPRGPGLSLSAYASPERPARAVVMVLPCGMPFELCLEWFLLLGERHFVVTWETRGLFGECADFDALDCSAEAQTDDLFAVLDHFGIADAHLMGICGGGMIALTAAARRPERIHSLSLWYGDYALADPALLTDHQKNFAWLVSAAAEGREAATDLHGMFLEQSLLATVPDDIAHHTLLPYVKPELLYRYAKLNHGLNLSNIEPLLARIGAPALVVAGESDTTTHAGGSAFVARGLRNARLRMEAGGDHQSFFSAPERSRSTAFEFINSAMAVPA